MPQEPKRRHSIARKGKRRAHIKLDVPQYSVCPNCGAAKLSHIVCPACGMYKGRQIV